MNGTTFHLHFYVKTIDHWVTPFFIHNIVSTVDVSRHAISMKHCISDCNHQIMITTTRCNYHYNNLEGNYVYLIGHCSLVEYIIKRNWIFFVCIEITLELFSQFLFYTPNIIYLSFQNVYIYIKGRFWYNQTNKRNWNFHQLGFRVHISLD